MRPGRDRPLRGSKLTAMDKAPGFKTLEVCPETWRVVFVLKVAEFVKDHVADKVRLKKEQFLVEVDLSLRRAAPPKALLVPDGEHFRPEADLFRDIPCPRNEVPFGKSSKAQQNIVSCQLQMLVEREKKETVRGGRVSGRDPGGGHFRKRLLYPCSPAFDYRWDPILFETFRNYHDKTIARGDPQGHPLRPWVDPYGVFERKESARNHAVHFGPGHLLDLDQRP